MTPDYREPDQWALQHKTEIHVSAWLVAIAAAAGIWKGSPPVQGYSALVLLVDLFLHSWLTQRWTPSPKDWLMFLYAKAADTDKANWLLEVEADFDEMWKLPPDSDLMEVLADE